ncbi:1-acyl-sn-glycerol-3-phosphate acyltransferase [Aliikangiella maris]|uniref:1-acyl-sn-glycerol-3-phosphate acyltransferase n=2 Tax=Aliikangiella maris TaxID=3162458 RepID=A0ABV2BZI9_9GAMM
MFDDIRPFKNDEVAQVIDALIRNVELQSMLSHFLMPGFNRFAPGISHLLVRLLLSFKSRKLNSIEAIQKEVARYAYRMLKQSCDGFTYQGLDKLNLNRPTLFISNHRDIALDPALVNIALFEAGANTAEIAIGSNLMSKDWIADLMRLNKCFIVKRGQVGKRAIFNASKELSEYIHHTLTNKQQHIWIAQREGRAKDGVDKTNSALISMLLLHKPKTLSIREYVEQLNIVPVSIAYEFDPCDKDKANELAIIETTGSYQKQEHEDIGSIKNGILGYKGRIHIEFGQPVVGDFEDSKALANAIDQQIIDNYHLFETNLQAHAQLVGESSSNEDGKSLTSFFYERLKDLDEAQKRWLLTMYANPVFAKQNSLG